MHNPMSLSTSYVDGQPMTSTLLRDSICQNIVVRKSLVKEEHFTGTHETCVLADGTRIVVPVAKNVIDSSYASA